ncbi:MAG: hypothetical protein QN131_05745 [Armatimonadota bacterium]|nr:hypothetical protein [Armatimonadota bacterium]
MDHEWEGGHVGTDLGCLGLEKLDRGFHPQAFVGPPEVVEQDVPREPRQHLLLNGERFEGRELAPMRPWKFSATPLKCGVLMGMVVCRAR